MHKNGAWVGCYSSAFSRLPLYQLPKSFEMDKKFVSLLLLLWCKIAESWSQRQNFYYDPYYYNHNNEYYPPSPHYDPSPYPIQYPRFINTNRREENLGWNFEPHEVMTEAKNAASMTRGMADLIDTRGQDFLSLFSDYSTTGN